MTIRKAWSKVAELLSWQFGGICGRIRYLHDHKAITMRQRDIMLTTISSLMAIRKEAGLSMYDDDSYVWEVSESEIRIKFAKHMASGKSLKAWPKVEVRHAVQR